MAEQTPFKEGVNAGVVRTLGGFLHAGDPRIDVDAFADDATTGLDALALKARVAHVAQAVARHVDPDFPTAVDRVLAGLPPAPQGAEYLGLGFTCWPLCRWISDRGLDHHDAAMAAVHAVTQRFSCEFTIRPFLAAEPERTLAVLAGWTRDPSPHVRRLVSEGTRPRLPWGQQLRRFMHDPTETLALLDALVDDTERYVTRSVANHLNDVSKDHPARAVGVAARWLKDATPERRWIVKHALRGRIKAGDATALAVLGFGPPALSLVRFEVPPHFEVGGKLALVAEVRSTSDQHQDLVVDVVVHFVKASGSRSPKVFKWTIRTLPAGGVLRLEKGLLLKPVSTRRYYPGAHQASLQINGQTLATRDFGLTLPTD